MTTTLAAIGVAFAVAAAFIFVQFKNPCDCGRSRSPYFARQHEKGWAMLFWVYWLVPFTVISFVEVNYLSAPINALLLCFHVRRCWLHEKDKMKKKAAKALGRVTTNHHGRLVVDTN